jgi:hypothetical protein
VTAPRVQHPLELVVDPSLPERCDEITDLVRTRWPDLRQMPDYVADAVCDVVTRQLDAVGEQLASDQMCCTVHAMVQTFTYWYLSGYQAAQWEAAQDADLDVPDDPGQAVDIAVRHELIVRLKVGAGNLAREGRDVEPSATLLLRAAQVLEEA